MTDETRLTDEDWAKFSDDYDWTSDERAACDLIYGLAFARGVAAGRAEQRKREALRANGEHQAVAAIEKESS